MPANLTPEYLKAEQWLREATTNEEKILALEEMLRVIPKHKGTDHMRAELRRKLSRFKEAAVQRKVGRRADVFHVPRSGAGQIALIGTPNCGKSALLAALTNAKVNVAPFPFATAAPVPGMVHFEDVQLQLVDMPPITAQFSAPGQVGTYRNCDLIAIVVELCGDIAGQMQVCLDFLQTRRLLIDRGADAFDDLGNVRAKSAVVIGTKADLAGADAAGQLSRLCHGRFSSVVVSTQTSRGLQELVRKLFESLNIIRIYAKPPGKPVDMDEPFVLPAGSTVMDLARSVHRELVGRLKSARAWGAGVRDGQNVQRNHVLADKDIIELHFA
jgi:hypothetical protein